MKRFLFLLTMLVLTLSTAMARETYPINEGWQFFFKSENDSEHARIISLPHSWNNNPLAGKDFEETTGIYLNELYIPSEWSQKRLFLHFHGAQSVANLFVNGYHMGEHRGGGTAFTFEITDHVRLGTTNLIQVVVSNNYRTDVLPVSTDINLYGGLYREVELLVTDRTAISPLYYGSEGVLVYPTEVSQEAVKGEVEVHLLTEAETDAMLRLDILNEQQKVVYTRSQRIRGNEAKSLRIPFGFEQPKLWSPEEPNRYRVEVSLLGRHADDLVRFETGFRAITVDEQTGWLAINGQTQRVRGVVLHHDNAMGGMPTTSDYEQDLHLVRDLGATAVRSAVMPHGKSFYDLCDREGLLVWIDLPLQRAPFLGDIDYFSTPMFEENAQQQMREIVMQHMNHPSVAMWGIYSRLIPRGDGLIDFIKSINTEVHRIDPSRPTVACSDQDGLINFITDLIVWHQEVGWQRGTTDDVAIWRDQLKENWSHLRSAISYGGEGFLGMRRLGLQRSKGSSWVSERQQAQFHEEYCRQLAADSLFWGIWIENMFEYGSARRVYSLNGQGLVTLNRREKKDAYYLYRALWNKERPTVHLVDRRYRLRSDEQQSFTVYSSVGEPTLLINDDTVAMHAYAPCQYRSDTVLLQGSVQVRVSADTWGDVVNLQIGSLLRPRTRLGLPQTTSPQTKD